MVVLGVIGIIAGFVLPWVRGLFSMEKRSRDELSALTEQRIDEGVIKNQLTNASIMRSNLITCQKTHLLMKNETPAYRSFNKSEDLLDFVSSKPLGIGTVQNNFLKITFSGNVVPGSLLFLRSINGDNEELLVRVKDGDFSSTSFSKNITFDYDLTSSVPSFTSCSFKNPENAQAYMNSFENKRFSVELVSFVQLNLLKEKDQLALYYQLWPQLGFLSLKELKNTNVTRSKLYDSIDSLNITESFDGENDSYQGNYFIKIDFHSVKKNTVQDGGVGVAGASVISHVISGAYSVVGLEIGNIRSGTALVVKPPKVTCSVMFKKMNKALKDSLGNNSALYEIKILFSEAESINTSTNPLNASINITSNSATRDPVKCYRPNQYSLASKNFQGDSFDGDISLSAEGGATSTDPVYCVLANKSIVNGRITYLVITSLSAQQYSPVCESVSLNL